MLSTLLYIYLTGAVGVTAVGSYGCYKGKFSGNGTAIGIEGPLCYGAATAAGVAWPVIAGFAVKEGFK